MPSSASSLNFNPDSFKMPLTSTSVYMPPQMSTLMHPHQDSFIKEKRRMNFECEICGKRLPSRREYIGHMNGRHLGQKPFSCELCGRQFAYITSLPMHRKTCPAAQLAKLNSTAPPPKISSRSSIRTQASLDASSSYQVNNNESALVDNSTFINSDMSGSLTFSINLPSSSSSTGNELDLNTSM